MFPDQANPFYRTKHKGAMVTPLTYFDSNAMLDEFQGAGNDLKFPLLSYLASAKIQSAIYLFHFPQLKIIHMLQS